MNREVFLIEIQRAPAHEERDKSFRSVTVSDTAAIYRRESSRQAAELR